jgi:hypothetical protein
MKESHLTVRVSAELARALDRWARERGLARAHLVREAVAAYLRSPAPRPAETVTASDLAERWRGVPRLTPEEAASFATDLEQARAALPAPRPWE